MEIILTPDQKLRVFISSTIEELSKERVAARKAISSIGLAPIFFEHGARPHNARDTYRAYLRQSDIYIGIFWEKYGYVDPAIGISGTEDELKLAIDSNKPKLIYIKKTSNNRDSRVEALIQTVQQSADCVFKYFDTDQELAVLVKENLLLMLTERFRANDIDLVPDYNSIEISLAKQQPTIQRDAVRASIEAALKNSKHVLLVGEPGIGKTNCLVQFVENRKNTLFVSLKNKQPLVVLTYIANKIRSLNGETKKSFMGEEPALLSIEMESQKLRDPIVLCLDGIDENIHLVKKINSLTLTNIRIVGSTRRADDLPGERLNIPKLSEIEIREVLKKWNKSISDQDFKDLVRASGGNPLYLFYFVKFQIKPLPDGLIAYQNALWASLSPDQKKVLRLTTLTAFPIKTSTMISAMRHEDGSGIKAEDVQGKVSSTIPLVVQEDGWLTVFHKYFEEFVYEKTNEEGLDLYYHDLLGKAYRDDKNELASIYHRALSGDKSTRPLEPTVQKAHFAGLNQVALDLLELNLQWAQEDEDIEAEGFAFHVLSDVLFEIGRYPEALECSNSARKIFEDIGNQQMLLFSRVQEMLLRLHTEDASEIAIQLRDLKEKNKSHLSLQQQGIICINLSYTLKQAGHYYEGALQAKEAYQIFSETDDIRGIIHAMVNINACLGNLGDQVAPLQKANAEQMIEVSKKYNWPRFELAGLNHLTQALRKIGDIPNAKIIGQKAIDLARSLNDVPREIMNICNLGNVIKDEKDWGGALTKYEEAISKSRSTDDVRSLGHALELAAECHRQKNDLPTAKAFVDEAIEIQTRLMDHFRLGECHVEYGEILEVSDPDGRAAARQYILASDFYLKANYVSKAVEWTRYAAQLLHESGDKSQAAEILKKRFSEIVSIRPDQAGRLLSLVDDYEEGSTHFDQYEQLFREALRQPKVFNLATAMVSFTVGARKDSRVSKTRFTSILYEILNIVQDNKILLNALAVAIDQSGEDLISDQDLDKFINDLVLREKHLYYRRSQDSSLFTISWGGEPPILIQIECYSDYTQDRKAALSISLILLANKDYFLERINSWGGFKEFSKEILIFPFDDFSTKISEGHEEPKQSTPAFITESDVPFHEERPPTVVVLHPEYQKFTSEVLYPGNKAIIWLLMSVYRAVIHHFTHKKDPSVSAREARVLCENIYSTDRGKSVGFDVSEFQLPDLRQKISEVRRSKEKSDQVDSREV